MTDRKHGMVGSAIAVLGHRASRKSWLKRRHKGIGASDMAAIMGCSPFTSLYALWWEKHEKWADSEETEAMHHGKGLEDYISQEFTRVMPQLIEVPAGYSVIKPPHALYMHAAYPWMLATPDRLLWTGEGKYEPIEFKTDEGGKWGTPGTDQIPRHHRIQVTQQMAVLGARRAHVVRFVRKRLTHYIVPFDESLFEDMVKAGEKFMTSLALNAVPPVDDHQATEDTLKRLHTIDEDAPPVIVTAMVRKQYEIAKRNLRQAKREMLAAQNFLREKMGNSATVADPEGEVFAKRSITERRGYYVSPAIVDTIRLTSRKDDE